MNTGDETRAACGYRLHGDVDLSVAPQVRADLALLIRGSAGDVVVDCTELRFIDSSGVATLLDAVVQLERRGRRLMLVNVPNGPRRVFEMCGVLTRLNYTPTGDATESTSARFGG